jgi:hypothetical protein
MDKFLITAMEVLLGVPYSREGCEGKVEVEILGRQWNDDGGVL